MQADFCKETPGSVAENLRTWRRRLSLFPSIPGKILASLPIFFLCFAESSDGVDVSGYSVSRSMVKTRRKVKTLTIRHCGFPMGFDLPASASRTVRFRQL
jgi:hypothetical protein